MGFIKKKQTVPVARRLLSVFSSKRAKLLAALILVSLPLMSFGAMKWHASALPCPCSALPANPTPTGTDTHSSGLEVGFKFRSSLNGYIRGIRFFKMSGMNGTHTGSLWDSSGNRLATATFSSETASGWQQVNFSTPVAVNANTIYTASAFMANGVYAYTSNYFTSDVSAPPLTIPRDSTAGDQFGNLGNGVANLTGASVYPTNTFNAANYWIDTVFTGAPTNDPPQVTAKVPAANATNVNLGETVSATFDFHMDGSTFTTNTFIVQDDQGTPIAGTVAYASATKKATFIPTNALATNKTYTAILKGGTGTVIKNLDAIALATDYSWSFTTASSDPCPCDFKGTANPAGSTTFDAAGGLELGLKVVPQANGYITSLKFYKPIISTETTHTGKIWSSTGTQLATVSFTNETDSGWQQAKLATPLQVTKDQLYIISYGTTTAVYQATAGALASGNLTNNSVIAYANGSTQNAATSSGNSNSVYSNTVGAYPSTSGAGDYYWLDAVFSTNPAPVVPLAVTLAQPKNNSFGVLRSTPITAAFNRHLNATTVTNSTVRLFDSTGSPVVGTASYNTATRSVLFTPTSTLAYGQKYTMRIASTVADTDGVTLGSEYSWSFTTGSQLNSTPQQGWTGGPILVVTSAASTTSKYYAEILRAEGLNSFETKDIATIDASVLNSFAAVVLSEMPLTQSQADMFSTWVNGGGNVVAMRPDKKLAGLLGLTDVASTRSNQYLTVDGSVAPGQGIVSESMQFKGVADNYTTSGATSVARFYSDANTSTANPAVTTRSVGSNGGTAMAFTYDLAKSVIAQHQGNQAWVGQNRDGGINVVRSNDLFYGAMTGDVQPDWVDLNKIHIPQADEQQRLLANMLTQSTKDKKPLPRFWYLPNNNKAAVVLAGDDHGLSNAAGTERIINNWLNESATDCSPIDWECVRATHYIYVASSLDNTRALQYVNRDFEIGNHPSNGGSCSDYSGYSQLSTLFSGSFTTWRAKYSNVPNQRTNRFHCYVWSDWDSQPRVDADNGIRYDLNYVAFPNTWVNGRSPLITGSGMNMRLTNASGTMLDVYQGVTNFDNTAANSTAVAATLDNAIGATGYYGMFGSHYDMTDSYDQTIFSAAKSRNIPLISAEQALEWLDGRNSSHFANFAGSNGQFTFTLDAAEGAIGLKAMMPMADAGGTVSSITLASNTISYQSQTIKGVQYAVFDGKPGEYTVTYTDYDPNAGGGTTPDPGTGNSGSSPGSESSMPAESTNPVTKKKTNTSLFNEEAQNIAEAKTAETQPDVTSTALIPSGTDNKDKEKELIQQDAHKTVSGQWGTALGILVGLVIVAGIWWFVAARRRRHQTSQW